MCLVAHLEHIASKEGRFKSTEFPVGDEDNFHHKS